MNEEDFPYTAKGRIVSLIETLEMAVKKSTDTDIRGIAVPVLEAVLSELKSILPNDPVVQATASTYLHQIETDTYVRAIDALLVAKQLDAAIGPYPLTF